MRRHTIYLLEGTYSPESTNTYIIYPSDETKPKTVGCLYQEDEAVIDTMLGDLLRQQIHGCPQHYLRITFGVKPEEANYFGISAWSAYALEGFLKAQKRWGGMILKLPNRDANTEDIYRATYWLLTPEKHLNGIPVRVTTKPPSYPRPLPDEWMPILETLNTMLGCIGRCEDISFAPENGSISFGMRRAYRQTRYQTGFCPVVTTNEGEYNLYAGNLKGFRLMVDTKTDPQERGGKPDEAELLRKLRYLWKRLIGSVVESDRPYPDAVITLQVVYQVEDIQSVHYLNLLDYGYPHKEWAFSNSMVELVR